MSPGAALLARALGQMGTRRPAVVVGIAEVPATHMTALASHRPIT
ncbi:hypothetical protein SEA_BURNSEY_40 [Gordonia phage Burnsey]|uniref:Uncharacterized protein n=1 Tax=Gordonia phage Burnsey TaxID=2775043 RepID=A0A7M1CN39_9CAUD|nr:hypothetical protein SEA_BURNSEY_40 [Gordonia phage Burnsey]